MSLRERLAYWVCPNLKDEIAALRDGNTRVVLENQRLLDERLVRAFDALKERHPPWVRKEKS